MTLGDILAKIKRYYPKSATWTDADIVSIINDEQREIFREMQKNDIYEFETLADQMIYTLPVSCNVEFIDYLGIATDNPITANSTFQEYYYADINEQLMGYKYFDALNGLIGIYPIPDKSGWNVKIIYRKRTALLSADNLNAVPDLNEDWQRILIYGAISEIASSGSNPDVTTANNFTAKYNDLMGEIKLAKYNNKPYPHTKNVKNWNR